MAPADAIQLVKRTFPGLEASIHELLGPLEQGPRRFLAFLFLNVVSWQSLLGTVLVLHARALAIDTARVGVLNSFIYFAGVLGLLTKPLAERIGSRRLLLTGWVLRNVLVAPVVATPWVFARWGVSGATLLLGATTLLFCVTRSMAGIAWSSWQHEIIPSAHLARFYTLETILTRLLTVCFGVLAFFVLGHNPPLWRFAAIAAVGVTAGLLSIRALARVPGGGPMPAAPPEQAWHHGFGVALRDRAFMRLLACAAAGSFATAGEILLLTLLLRDRLHLGAGTILLVTSLGSALTLVTTIRWRRLADTHGGPITIAAATLLLGACMAALTPIGVWHAPLLYAAAVCLVIPVAESGNYVATTRSYMLHMNARHRHAYNAIWSAFVALGGGLSSLLVGWSLRGGTALRFTLVAGGYALLMVVIAVCVLRLSENGQRGRDIHSPLFDPRRPWRSIVHLWGYVLHPGVTSHDIGSETPRAPET